MSDFGDIDYAYETFSAALASGSENVDKAKPIFRNRIYSKFFYDTLKDPHPDLNQAHLNLLWKKDIFKGLEKGIGFLTQDAFKIFGKGVGLIDAAKLSYDLFETWTSSDKSFGDKVNTTGQQLTGFISGMFVSAKWATIGAKIGGAIGTFFCPGAGTAVGAFIGGAIGAFAGQVFGGKIGELAWNGYGNLLNSGVRKLAGVAKSFTSGGVEFILPKKIPEFEKKFCFTNIHYIAFEFESIKNDFNPEMIIDFLNKNFLLIKINGLDKVFDTILKEIAYGFLNKKVLPEISLNFNKDKLLYSIMDDFYRNTLTGNILTFLDYYLKCYVNGGFFKENFIFNWQNNKNEDKEYLNSNINDFRQYLYNLTHDPNEIDYYSIYDLGQKEKFESNYISAFRIIGYIKNQLYN